jgi:Lar family restriction alleviation protein
MFLQIEKCPFCGGNADTDNNMRSVWVECYTCGGKGPCFNGRDATYNAVRAWNQRVTK